MSKREDSRARIVAHTYNPSYWGGRGRRIMSSRPIWVCAKLARSISEANDTAKRDGGMAQVMEHLPGKCKHWVQSPVLKKNQNNNNNNNKTQRKNEES
jgi:hypothetical protein